MPIREELPSTIRRSPKKAQETWQKTLENAVKTYGPGRRAMMTAYASLKHSFQKVGDHWEPKAQKGPSDPHAAAPYGSQRYTKSHTYGGVDMLQPKRQLLSEAKARHLDVSPAMTKDGIAKVIEKANDRETAASRRRT